MRHMNPTIRKLKLRSVRALIGLGLALSSTAVRADVFGTANNNAGKLGGIPEAGWSLGAGIHVANPGYVGLHNQVTPFPFITYRNGNFFISGFVLGYALKNNKGFSFALVVSPQIMRFSASNDPQLAGMQSRKWSLDGGFEFSIRRRWGNLSFGVRHDLLNRSNGTTAKIGYGFSIPLGTGHVTPSISAMWENANFANYYYGVSQAESTPTRPAYSPGSAVNPSLSLSYGLPITHHWRMNIGATYMRFGGSIRNSPIIDESSVMSYSLIFIYRFGGRRH